MTHSNEQPTRKRFREETMPETSPEWRGKILFRPEVLSKEETRQRDITRRLNKEYGLTPDQAQGNAILTLIASIATSDGDSFHKTK
jgi:hypothetical protein